MFFGESLLILLYIAWYIVYLIQMFLGYGTAYRYTKRNGDNGVSLFGWMIVFGLVAAIPVLGFYFWKKAKKMPNRRNMSHRMFQMIPYF
jgi:hypothetical protein